MKRRIDDTLVSDHRGYVLIAVFVVLAAFGIAGVMDAGDEQMEAMNYTDMVCEGHWPDYKELAPDCVKHSREKILGDIIGG